MHEMHGLSYCFFIKIERIRAAKGGRKMGAIRARNQAPWTSSSAAHARPAEALLPPLDDLPVVDIVQNATLECGDHRAGGPGDPLPKLAAFGVGGRMGRQQHPV